MDVIDISGVVDLSKPVAQARFAALIGISQPAVSDMVNRNILRRGGTAGEWLLAYCDRMREQAAGRTSATAGSLDPAAQNARHKKELADEKAMDNAERRRELVPAVVVAKVLAEVASRANPILEALPIKLRRACKALTADDLDIITHEIAAARNQIAGMELNWEKVLD